MKALLAVIVLVSLQACATAYKTNRLSLGMTKEEAIYVMGRPASTAAYDGAEYLTYRLVETETDGMYGIETPYFVRIVDGVVESYGRVGDFDSTKDEVTKVEIKALSD